MRRSGIFILPLNSSSSQQRLQLLKTRKGSTFGKLVGKKQCLEIPQDSSIIRRYCCIFPPRSSCSQRRLLDHGLLLAFQLLRLHINSSFVVFSFFGARETFFVLVLPRRQRWATVPSLEDGAPRLPPHAAATAGGHGEIFG